MIDMIVMTVGYITCGVAAIIGLIFLIMFPVDYVFRHCELGLQIYRYWRDQEPFQRWRKAFGEGGLAHAVLEYHKPLNGGNCTCTLCDAARKKIDRDNQIMQNLETYQDNQQE